MVKRSEGAKIQAERRTSRHPTPLPAFDMEQFARESEQGLRIADEAPTRRRFDHSAMLEVAPTVEVDEALSDDEEQLVFWARIGDDTQVLVLARSLDALLTEPRVAGDALVLSAIDGHSTVRAVVDACGLPALSALQAICDLLDRGAVTFAR